MNSNWTGNNKTVFSQLGASNHSEKERETHDYYATDSVAIDKLLEKTTLSRNVWECACGEGHLSKRLAEYGYNVKSTDLIDRGFGVGGGRLLKMSGLFRWRYNNKSPIQICKRIYRTCLNTYS